MRPLPDGLRASTHPLDRAAAARDLWPGGTLDFWQGRLPVGPDLVVWPEDESQIESALQWAQDNELAVVTYGAGSGVCGGARGRPGTLVLDTKRLHRIGPLDEERWTVEAEAGVNGQILEDWLNERGYTLGHSPSSIWCSTVGGWAAARSAGQFSSRYGVFEDMVLQLRAVTPGRGTIVVGEDGDAPDEWMPLLLGSEGTLGVITRVRMRVWPQPKARWLRGYAFDSVEGALTAMRELMQGELWPSALRLYDPVDTRIGGKTKPKKKGGPSASSAWYSALLEALDDVPALKRRSLVLPLSLPGLVNRVFDRAADGVFLVVGFEGDPEVVALASEAGHAICAAHGEDLGPDPGQRWFDSRHAVSYKLMPIFERGGFADTMEVAMSWSDLPRVYEAVREAVQPHAVIMAHMSHLYPEGGSIYFSFAGKGERATYEATWKAALAAVLASGATTTHHHGVGSLKAKTASREIGPAIEGWKAIRRQLDPRGCMNPGRLFVEGQAVDAGPSRQPAATDGLAVAGPADGPRPDAMYPWEALPAVPRWQRNPWQVGWVGVDGTVDGKRCRLGRGPRSAAGPDLRGWLLRNADDVRLTVPVAPDGPRWLGEAQVDKPWQVARELLRSDLRPAVLTVVDGRLLVGFRGPAAAAMGQLASARVDGGLTERDWTLPALPAGKLVPCTVDDDAAVHVNLQGAFRRGSP